VRLTIAVVVVVWYIVIELFLKGFIMARGSRHRKGSVGKRPGGKRHAAPLEVLSVSSSKLSSFASLAGGRARRPRGYSKKRFG